MPVKIDTMLLGLADAAENAVRLEEMGLDGVFTFEGPHDPFVPLVLAARATDLDLATNVAIAFPRNPVQLAHLAWDLGVLAEGRFALGLGTQIRTQIVKRYGASFDPPVPRMRELIAALRAVWESWETGGRLDFRGDYFHHTLMTPMFDPGPHPFAPPPVWLGALGPRMTELAAESADGLLVMPFNSGRHFRERTLPAVERGLARAGRLRAELMVMGEVILCVGRTEEELAVAKTGTRMLLSFYASTPAYTPVLSAEGWEDLQPELNKLSKAGRWTEMADLIDDSMLERLAAVGTPETAARAALERFGDEVDRIGFYTPYAVPGETLAETVSAMRSLT